MITKDLGADLSDLRSIGDNGSFYAHISMNPCIRCQRPNLRLRATKFLDWPRMRDSVHDEKMIHRFFILTILAKGSLGLVQIATAVAIIFGVTSRLPSFAQSIIAAELAEDPNDFLAAQIMS